MRKPVPTGWGQRLSCSGTRSLYRRPFCCSSSSICFASSTTALPLINPSVPMVLKIAANIKNTAWGLDDSRDSNLSETNLAPAASGAPGSFFSPAGEPQKSASVAQPSIKQSASAKRRPASELEEKQPPGDRVFGSSHAARPNFAPQRPNRQKPPRRPPATRPPREGAPKGFEPRAD